MSTTPSPAASSRPPPMFSVSDRRWLDALAGAQPPDIRDPAQRQAAQLRGYCAQRDAQELANPLPSATQARHSVTAAIMAVRTRPTVKWASNTDAHS